MMTVDRRWIFSRKEEYKHAEGEMAIWQRGNMARLCGRSKYVGQLNKCPLPLPLPLDGLYVSLCHSEIGIRPALLCPSVDVLCCGLYCVCYLLCCERIE